MNHKDLYLPYIRRGLGLSFATISERTSFQLFLSLQHKFPLGQVIAQGLELVGCGWTKCGLKHHDKGPHWEHEKRGSVPTDAEFQAEQTIAKGA